MAAGPADPPVFHFDAMASPCEVRLDGAGRGLLDQVGRAVQAEALRIEAKFSRYRADSVVGRINAAAGGPPVTVDEETARLLGVADRCFELSGGLFDITSGVLRRAWRFDGSDRMPDAAAVEAVRDRVGWRRLSWRPPAISLPDGMEIDFGGVGKEYAVDRAIEIAASLAPGPVLVNFGGDLRVTGPRADGRPWSVAIESVEQEGLAAGLLALTEGALATSGDARRFLLRDGVRYSHILDPRTGWPVVGAPRSVTVAAATCIEAGLLATLAMLHGPAAEDFLAVEGVRAWCIR